MKKNRLLVLILFVGVVIRAYLAITRNVFTDEVFYYTVARNHNLWDFILIDHWIKDHAILHFIWLKGGLLLTTRIAYLRLLNLVFYIGSALALFQTFKLLKFGKWSLLPVLFFTIHGHFIYVSSMILPYSIVIFFALLSVWFSIKITIGEPNPSWFDYAFFIIFTTLASYSDYSFLSMFIFYFQLFLIAAIFKRQRFLGLLVASCIALILILPGMSQLFHNYDAITQLNTTIGRNENLLLSFYRFCDMTVLHTNSLFSLIFFLFYLALIFIETILILRNKDGFISRDKRTFFVLVSAAYYKSVLLFLLINQYIFTIFVERASWFFPLFSLVMICTLIYFYYERKNKFYIVILLLFLLTRASNMTFTPGGITYEVSYRSFLREYVTNSKTQDDRYLFLVDDEYKLFPLRYYYLSPFSVQNTQVDVRIKSELAKRNTKIMYMNETDFNKYNFRLPEGIDYGIVFPSCDVTEIPKKDFVKRAESIYCLRRLTDNKYIFVRYKEQPSL